MHARTLSIIRKTNPTRLVIFQGHNWGGADELITAAIPDDDYLIGSFHSYDPYLFGLEGQGTWGSAADYNELDRKFKAVADWSEENNVPVFLGEFGAINKGDYNSRMRHYRAYLELSYQYGFAPLAWDDGGNFRIMEREQKDWNEVKDILIYTNAKSPKPFAVVYQDSIIQISWSAYTSDHDSIIVQQKLGTQRHFSTVATFSPEVRTFNLEKPAVNRYYDFRIIAHYTDTTDLYSQPVRLFFPEWTRPVRTPFNDTLHVIPGIIEAEDFDEGGEGFTYHDSDEINLAGKYRTDVGVDIYDRLGEGFHVGNTMPGEWLEYSVNITTEGWYNVSAHIATYNGGGKFQIDVDTVSSAPVTVKASNSPLNTLPNSVKMYLYPGRQIMRFTILEGPSFNIDKIEFEQVDASERFNINKKLVTPEPEENAVRLYQFLYDNYGKKINSGVMTLHSMDEVNWLKTNTGKEPALLGLDFMHCARGYTWYNNEEPVNDAKNYYNRNGIPAFCWHWRDPSRNTEAFYTDDTDFDVSKISDESSPEYQAILSDIDYISGLLKKLQNDGVPVLWRPLHEASGGWFWWGAKGPEPCKTLYRLMYNRMVNHHGLKNLIWVWTSQQDDYNWYPGDDVVDIIGRDIYKDGDHSSQILEFSKLNDEYGGKKMITLSECGSFPDADNLMADEAAWFYFMPWYGQFVRDSKYNSPELWKKMLAHEYVLTIDEMPDLKSYTSTHTSISLHHPEDDLKIFPTIVSGELNIHSKEPALEITIYSVSGAVLKNYRFSSSNAVVSFSGFIPGIYFIKINQFKTVRVVKI